MLPPLPVRVVASLLTLREFVAVCGVVDAKEGTGTLFRVIDVKREDNKLAIMIKTTAGKELLVTL